MGSNNNTQFKTIEQMAITETRFEELEKKAEQILGVEYTYVYNFFDNVFKDAANYKWIIAKVRRDFVLAQIFCGIFIAKHKNDKREDDKSSMEYDIYVQASKKLRSDIFLSSPQFISDNEKGKIIVLDDVIIHGRALAQLVAYLEMNGFATELTANSIIVCKDAECISDNLYMKLPEDKKRAKIATTGTTVEGWKKLSNKFVELIQYAGQSYAAFIDSYKPLQDMDVLGMSYGYKATDVRSEVQTNAKLDMTVLYPDSNFNPHKTIECLRLYTRDAVDSAAQDVVIPFVTLPMVKKEEWRAAYRQMSLFANVQDVKNIKGTHGSVDIYAYKLISNLVSNMCAEKNDMHMMTSNNLLYSFGITADKVAGYSKEAFNLLDVLHINPFGGKINEFNIDGAKTITDNKEFYDREMAYFEGIPAVALWMEVISEAQNEKYTRVLLKVLLKKYLDRLHNENEKRARKQQTRLQGIPLYALFVVLKYYKYEYNWGIRGADLCYFYACLLSMWDSGIASYTVEEYTIKGTQYIGGCVTDGEQAYHALLEKGSGKEVYVIQMLNVYAGGNISKVSDMLEKVLKADIACVLNRVFLHNTLEYLTINGTINELVQIYKTDSKDAQAVENIIGTASVI